MIERITSELRYRWRAIIHRRAMETELDQELHFHVEREAEKLMAEGLPEAEARRMARLRFGSHERMRDDTRDAHGISWLDHGWADLRYAARVLRSRPVFTLGVAGALALGIGANAAMFGIVDRLMFREPNGLRTPDLVHRVYLNWVEDGEARVDRTMQFARVQDLSRQATTIDAAAGFAVRVLPVGVGEATREERVAVVSAGYFPFFEATPVLGRWFGAAEDAPPAGAPVVVLSYDYWQSAFGGQREVLGRTLQVDRLTATVIGVAPPGFTGVNDAGAPVAFVPVTAYAHAFRGAGYVASYNWGWLEMLVRRKPGVAEEQATADLTAAFLSSWRAEARVQGPTSDEATWKPAVTLGSVHLGRGPEARLDTRVAMWITGVALIVLLIACANVANLMLSQAVSRQREVALRLALGAGRWRLARQLLLEGVLLGLLGGTAGMVLARFGGGALRGLLLPDADATAVLTDGRTIAWSMGLALLAGLLTGLVPAVAATRTDVTSALKAGGRGATARGSVLRSSLVVAQAALSVVLLVGAGLFVRSLTRAQEHRLGMDIDPVLHTEVNMRGTRLGEAEGRALVRRLLAVAQATPGVTSATMAISVPFWSSESQGLYVPGIDSVRKLGRFVMQAGTAEYFAATGTRILKGRGLVEADREGSALVIVVSEGMARALWPGQEALGQCVRVGDPTAPCRSVVGISEETSMEDFAPARQYTYVLPVEQFPQAFAPQFFVRPATNPVAVIPLLRARMQAELPGAAYARVTPMREMVQPQLRAWQFGATMFVAFGVLALILATLGMYSLVSYEVAQRQKELGVRLALGAPVGTLLSMVVRRSTGLAAIGLAIGTVAALATSGPIESLLFQVSPRDPAVLGAVAGLLIAVAIVASLVPALRATRTDPNRVLRAD